ncbi:MAG: MarR family winged helix-turn-helix transcriptional regulator [Sulfuricurvum sp.]
MNRCECPLGDTLGCLANHAAFAARSYLSRQLELNGIDMTIEQFKVMIVLWKEKISTQQNIADFVGKDKASVARLIAGLEKRSLIRRTTDCSDKRCNRVTLTPQGSALEEATMKILSDANKTLCAQFDDELAIAMRVLKKMCLFIHYPENPSKES